MDIARSLFGEILAIAGYAVLFAAVYKLFQISTDLGEIKDLLKGQRRNNELLVHAQPGNDGADEYARNLLRAVSAESHRTENGPREAV